jgi:hypothetical protein
MKRIFKNHKAQAALEYLVTYGWAFLVIIAAISALAYFGILTPKNYMPEKCDFGQQLSCVDQYIDTNGKVILRFKNDFGANISVTNAYGDFVDSFGTSGAVVPIGRGEIKQVQLTVNKTVTAESKERFRFIIEFQRQGGTAKHNITGSIFTEVSEPLT